MTGTSAGPRRWLDRLLHLHDTPRRTAAAFALGVFFSFSPFIGLQILCSMTLAFLLGLNRVAVFVGLNANLPWFVVPWYAGATLVAARALGVPLPEDFRAELGAVVQLSPGIERLLGARGRAGSAVSRAVPGGPDRRGRRDRHNRVHHDRRRARSPTSPREWPR